MPNHSRIGRLKPNRRINLELNHNERPPAHTGYRSLSLDLRNEKNAHSGLTAQLFERLTFSLAFSRFHAV
jgi:hypothetical protein